MTTAVVAWLRALEAQELVMRLGNMDEACSRSWLVRLVQDRVRGDAQRYSNQNSVRLHGYPMRKTSHRALYDWPMRLASDDFDWPASTVRAPHGLRLIEVDVLIEFSRAEIEKALLQKQQPREKSPAVSRANIEKAVDDYIASDPEPIVTRLDAFIRGKGFTDREHARKLFRQKRANQGKPVTRGRKKST